MSLFDDIDNVLSELCKKSDKLEYLVYYGHTDRSAHFEEQKILLDKGKFLVMLVNNSWNGIIDVCIQNHTKWDDGESDALINAFKEEDETLLDKKLLELALSDPSEAYAPECGFKLVVDMIKSEIPYNNDSEDYDDNYATISYFI